MRTSLNEIQLIDKFLHHEMKAEDALVFEAGTIVNRTLQINIFWQKKVYELLKYYHRKKLKDEAEQIHQRIFNDPAKYSFKENILQLFS